MGRKPDPVFREKQNPLNARTYIALCVPPIVMFGLTIWQVVLGHPWGRHPMSNSRMIGWTIFLCLIYLRLVTVRLRTEVRDGQIAVALRGVWPARSIALSDVKSAKIVTYDPVRDYGGYGIRSFRGGKAYIARGTEGVQLDLKAGGSVLVGSQRARELLGAVLPR